MITTTIPAIERQLDFRATPERMWRAITDDAELGAWFGQSAHLVLRPGADGWFEWEGHGRVPVRTEVVEPITRLAWRWGDVGKSVDDGSTLVEFRLEPLAGGGTRLHLRESGFAVEASRWSNTEGWLSELAELAQHVAAEPFEAGIRRTYALTSSIERVWRAFSDPAELGAWWAGSSDIDIRPGAAGWWVWPSEGGRFGMRIEAVEPPRYLCWSWATVPDVPVADADQVLRTEWTLVPREDGGTDLHLFESGFTGPKDFESNDGGWDGDVIPGLRKHLGEA
ncbi:MAG TPA: SRPBCC domain-containing protein [Candidatus Limnocylindrales bacterium]